MSQSRLGLGAGGQGTRYGEFAGAVENQARLPSRRDAVQAIQATLETLVERIKGSEADDLAAQPPPEPGRFLLGKGDAEWFSVHDFILCVGAKESADVPDAAHMRVWCSRCFRKR